MNHRQRERVRALSDRPAGALFIQEGNIKTIVPYLVVPVWGGDEPEAFRENEGLRLPWISGEDRIGRSSCPIAAPSQTSLAFKSAGGRRVTHKETVQCKPPWPSRPNSRHMLGDTADHGRPELEVPYHGYRSAQTDLRLL